MSKQLQRDESTRTRHAGPRADLRADTRSHARLCEPIPAKFVMIC